MKTIYIFGNPDLPDDSLPLWLLPKLQATFPDMDFKTLDPNEDWRVPEDLTVIDTVQGIEGVQVFDGLDYFKKAPRVSMHDFDALTNLLLLEKLGKLKKITIIGIPPTISDTQALESMLPLLNTSSP